MKTHQMRNQYFQFPLLNSNMVIFRLAIDINIHCHTLKNLNCDLKMSWNFIKILDPIFAKNCLRFNLDKISTLTMSKHLHLKCCPVFSAYDPTFRLTLLSFGWYNYQRRNHNLTINFARIKNNLSSLKILKSAFLCQFCQTMESK